MGRAKQSPGAWLGVRRSIVSDANCGVAAKVPSRSQRLMDFVTVGGRCHPSQRPGTHLYS